jgi:WD40 repeat protein
MAFIPDGRVLALVDTERGHGPYDLCDLTTGRKLFRFSAEIIPFTAAAFSPNARSLATGHRDGTILIWDLATFEPESALRSSPVTAAQLHRCWSDLAETDAGRANEAIRVLCRVPARAIQLLRERLRPVPDDRHARLITGLDDPSYAVREKAFAELAQLGFKAESALRMALDDKPSLEVRRRIERLLHALEQAPPPQEVIRQVRAVQVLEQIGSAEAKCVLEDLSKGAPRARLTQESRESLGRFSRPSGQRPD